MTEDQEQEFSAGYLQQQTKRLRDLVESHMYMFKNGKAIQEKLNACYITIVADIGMQQQSSSPEEPENPNQESLLCTACDSGYVKRNGETVACEQCGGTGVKPNPKPEGTEVTATELVTGLIDENETTLTDEQIVIFKNNLKSFDSLDFNFWVKEKQLQKTYRVEVLNGKDEIVKVYAATKGEAFAQAKKQLVKWHGEQMDTETMLKHYCDEQGYEVRIHEPSREGGNFIVNIVNRKDGLLFIEKLAPTREKVIDEAHLEFIEKQKKTSKKPFAEQLDDEDRNSKIAAGLPVPKKSEKAKSNGKNSNRRTKRRTR